MSFLFINKTLRLNNFKIKTAMNAKVLVFVICVEAIIYLLLYNLHDCTFNLAMRSSVDTIKCLVQVCKNCGKNVIIISCLFKTSTTSSERFMCVQFTSCVYWDIKETVLRTVSFPKFTLVFRENSIKIVIHFIAERTFINFWSIWQNA